MAFGGIVVEEDKPEPLPEPEPTPRAGAGGHSRARADPGALSRLRSPRSSRRVIPSRMRRRASRPSPSRSTKSPRWSPSPLSNPSRPRSRSPRPSPRSPPRLRSRRRRRSPKKRGFKIPNPELKLPSFGKKKATAEVAAEPKPKKRGLRLPNPELKLPSFGKKKAAPAMAAPRPTRRRRPRRSRRAASSCLRSPSLSLNLQGPLSDLERKIVLGSVAAIVAAGAFGYKSAPLTSSPARPPLRLPPPPRGRPHTRVGSADYAESTLRAPDPALDSLYGRAPYRGAEGLTSHVRVGPTRQAFARPPRLVPPLIFMPVITVLAGTAAGRMGVFETFAWIGGGYLFWTLTEYWLHRVIFHFEPEDGVGARLHWIMHGVHHDHPNDPMRLVMPPSVSVPLSARLLPRLLFRARGDRTRLRSARASWAATCSTT